MNGNETHQRREKGMSHGEFLYLVFEGKCPRSTSWQEAVLYPQLAQVGYDDPRRTWAFRNEDNWGTSFNIQQNPGRTLRMFPYLQDRKDRGEENIGEFSVSTTFSQPVLLTAWPSTAALCLPRTSCNWVKCWMKATTSAWKRWVWTYCTDAICSDTLMSHSRSK